MKGSPDLDCGPFQLCEPGKRAPRPRLLDTPQGLGDRLRTAAFAEWQAVTAFGWAAERYADAPEGLRRSWRDQVADEERHCRLLLGRMEELGFDPAGRPVSDALWRSLRECPTAREFCLFMTGAEERGRQAAVQLSEALVRSDPATSGVFAAIAADEERHVALADLYYGPQGD